MGRATGAQPAPNCQIPLSVQYGRHVTRRAAFPSHDLASARSVINPRYRAGASGPRLLPRDWDATLSLASSTESATSKSWVKPLTSRQSAAGAAEAAEDDARILLLRPVKGARQHAHAGGAHVGDRAAVDDDARPPGAARRTINASTDAEVAEFDALGQHDGGDVLHGVGHSHTLLSGGAIPGGASPRPGSVPRQSILWRPRQACAASSRHQRLAHQRRQPRRAGRTAGRGRRGTMPRRRTTPRVCRATGEQAIAGADAGGDQRRRQPASRRCEPADRRLQQHQRPHLGG